MKTCQSDTKSRETGDSVCQDYLGFLESSFDWKLTGVGYGAKAEMTEERAGPDWR